MTAGRGIIHSEMPKQDNGLMWGFQLWVNLPAVEKMTAPRYQDIPPEEVPEATLTNGTRIRVIAGASAGLQGAVRGIVTAPLYLDVDPPGGEDVHSTSPARTCRALLCFCWTRAARSDGYRPRSQVAAQHLAILSDGEELTVRDRTGTCAFSLTSRKTFTRTDCSLWTLCDEYARGNSQGG